MLYCYNISKCKESGCLPVVEAIAVITIEGEICLFHPHILNSSAAVDSNHCSYLGRSDTLLYLVHKKSADSDLIIIPLKVINRIFITYKSINLFLYYSILTG